VDREIDWSSAEVKDGKLTVRLIGEPDTDWTESCESVLDVHEGETHAGGWGKALFFFDDRFLVDDVEPGSEAALRQYLENIVQQANREAVQRKQRNAEGKAMEEAAEAANLEASKKMTDAFRGFEQG
jgi:hypothetical protein